MLLAAYLALYFGAWGWFARRILAARRSVFAALFGLPAAWVVLEYLRGTLLTGFGWNLLAHTQWNWIPVIQIADLTGCYGVSFLVVLVNAGLYLAIRKKRGFSASVPLGVAGLFVLAALFYGEFLIPVTSMEQEFRVAVAQGNVPQPKKWDDAFAEAIWKRYEERTEEAAQARPDMILWPETAVPGYLEEPGVLERLQSIARRARLPLLAGAPAEGEEGELFNSALLVDSGGEPVRRYHKIHLVPFGEFFPFKPLFEWLKKFYPIADFSPGADWTVFPRTGPVPPFSVLICFEDLFPGISRRFVREGAGWLVVITNDAWFGRSAASLQHLQASVFRAVENRVWVARAANTGWSGFVDPAGRRLAHPLPRFQPGAAVAELKVGSGSPSLYSRLGDWFVGLCGIIIFFGVLPWRRWISLSSNELRN